MTITQQATQADPRPLLLAAAAQVTPYVERVTLADLDRPTPCDEWAVRDLLSHLVGVATRVPHLMRGGHPADVPAVADGVPDDGWAAAWAARQPAFVAALAEDGVLGRTVHHPAGDMPAPAAIGTYVSELVTHAWDLAAALGDTAGLDDSLAEACFTAMQRALPAEIRHEAWVPFGAVVPVPDDAPAVERLVGWVGRDPRWPA